MSGPSAPPRGIAQLDAPNRYIGTSLAAQIETMLRSRIDSGEWPAHYRLPPEPELAEMLCVSRGTLRKATMSLVAQGRLSKVRGRGTFVTPSSIESTIATHLTTITEDLSAHGISVVTDVRDQQLIPAPSAIAALLGAEPGTQILRLERLRSDDAGPIALLVNYVRADLVPGIESADLAAESLFNHLETRRGLVISHARRAFNAAAAPNGIAQLLKVAVGSPLLFLEQTTYLESGGPIETSEVWINSSRLRPTAILPRHPNYYPAP